MMGVQAYRVNEQAPLTRNIWVSSHVDAQEWDVFYEECLQSEAF